jgi:hypothetical protein
MTAALPVPLVETAIALPFATTFGELQICAEARTGDRSARIVTEALENQGKDLVIL